MLENSPTHQAVIAYFGDREVVEATEARAVFSRELLQTLTNRGVLTPQQDYQSFSIEYRVDLSKLMVVKRAA